ncbi:MAG: double-strand break repair protein AddB, partial [Paracoccus sp. (in: a-proteobacteria)]|nr:double-strand break repair protein AddB [Paracoccus sp. (in: a-proteobacteria)]
MSWPGWQSGYFSLPPGADFAREVVRGVMDRAKGQPPEALAAVTILANSGRTLRSVRAAFDDYAAAHGALLLPRMELVGQIGADLPGAARAPLARQLELGQLVAKMIEAQPGLADGQSVPELTASLSALMAEMQTEGRAAGDLERADAGAHAAHWQRALMFLKIAAAYYLGGAPVDAPARQRLRAEQLADAWSRGQDLPRAPLLLVGSTGSHGATRLLLRAVASLPQGAVVLPGYDDSMAAEMWDQIAEASEDHPQARLAALREGGVRPWTDARGPDARNRLISLALRPAPVTDQWIAEGPSLDDLQEASEGLSLIVAEHPQQEADAIALAIREAVGARRPVTLFAADRAITRRVAAALDRWGIHLHDSAGQPLSLTDTGLFLRHVVAAFGQPLTIDVLMTIFKHRMAAAGAEDGAHLLHLRALELDLRRRGPAFPDGAALRDWGAKGDDARQAWAGWMAGLLDRIAEAARDTGPRAAAARLDDLTSLAGAIADGPDAAGGDALWRVRGGAKVQAVIALLRQHIALAHKMRPGEFAELVTSILQSDASREPARSAVRACGTREARTEANRGDGALVIIAGLNEGSWPQALSHDPWLSRQMRRDVGLTLPERQIGLAAHDFQQAAAAPEVILSRARRDNDAETIPSRWLNRLLNLMNGLPAQNGALATKQMEARGARWTALARQMAGPRRVDPPAPRPAPIPPAPSFNRISVTEVKTLIRDPYAIYAKKVLRLEKLPGLRPEADALLRGNTLHRIV